MRTVLAGLRFQLWRLRHNIDELQGFFLAPLFTAIFGGLFLASGHRGELSEASVGAALVCVWWICAQAGGNIIESERWQGTFETLSATPAPLHLIVLGRSMTVVGVAGFVFPEVWLMTLLIFGVRQPIPHPGLLLMTVALTLLGFLAATSLIAATFVLARQAVILGNATSYPIFFLSGLLFPVSDLPVWIQPCSRLIFLSWSSELLRTSLSAEPTGNIWPSLAGLIATATGTAVGGLALLRFVVNQARTRGTLSLA